MSLELNIFDMHIASENGFVLHINNALAGIFISTNIFTNNSMMSKSQVAGSVVFLDNPGNITIIGSLFENNLGILGTCISYSEKSITVILNKI